MDDPLLKFPLIRRIREEGKAELVRSRNESMKMEAAISAAQERNLQLRKRLEEVQREQQARAYLPAGSVASPPIRSQLRSIYD